MKIQVFYSLIIYIFNYIQLITTKFINVTYKMLLCTFKLSKNYNYINTISNNKIELKIIYHIFKIITEINIIEYIIYLIIELKFII